MLRVLKLAPFGTLPIFQIIIFKTKKPQSADPPILQITAFHLIS